VASVEDRLAELETTEEQLGYGLDGLAERIDALQSETDRRLAELAASFEGRLETLELANRGLVATIEHEAAEIDARITAVHTEALRTLTAQAERSNPA
jgi:uncharacterized small protein (DUF1192 family)